MALHVPPPRLPKTQFADRRVFTIRNVEKDRFSILIEGRRTVLAFNGEESAHYLTNLIDTTHRTTGEWPQIDLGEDDSEPSLRLYLGPADMNVRDFHPYAENLPDLVQACALSLLDLMIIDSFDATGGTIKMNGDRIRQVVDAQVARLLFSRLLGRS